MPTRFCHDSHRLAGFDFAGHNDEVRKAWAAHHAGRPYRVPITLGTNARFFMAETAANPGGLDFRTYSENPDVMFDTQLQFQYWSKHNLLQDAELGVPDRWSISVDFQNYYEAGWFGCTVEYLDGQVPDTRPAFANYPEGLLEAGVPDPFGGLQARGLEYYEHFQARAQAEDYYDRPIEVLPPALGVGTDGVLTVACSLFGADFVCLTLAEDPDRMRRLFEFITEATITRMTAWRERCMVPVPQDGFGFADDSLALISVDMYREQVLPHHRRLCEAFATDKPRGIHLCGDATRHFHTLRDELNIRSFDTGFPVDHGALRGELGPDVRLQGGPHIALLRDGSPGEVEAETKRILESGVLEGGLFILREGNNLAPGTPLENIEAMYKAGRRWGRVEP